MVLRALEEDDALRCQIGSRREQDLPALVRRAAPALRPLATEAARDMDKKGKAERDSAKAKTGPDAITHSFGESYATRSDEEGFGGIYEGSKSANNIQVDRDIHANHPAYDKTQGSEVKEKGEGAPPDQCFVLNDAVTCSLNADLIRFNLM